MLLPVAPREVQLEGGRRIDWQGMFTGHLVLSQAQVSELGGRLLGIDLAELPARLAALPGEHLVPHQAQDGVRPPALVLHSATATLRAYDGDAAEFVAGREPHDTATYIEARSVYLAQSGDLCVGRTAPWREAVELRSLPAVDVLDTEHYYLSQALLTLAADHAEGRDTPLPALIDWLRERPTAVIRLYALDVETQIFLLWLQRRAGLDRLAVEANSPVISKRWNRKSHIHPSVGQVLDLPTEGLDVEELLRVEQRHSEAYRRLAMVVPVLPGYLIARDGVDLESFVADVLAAAALLRERYGIALAGLKPSEAGDGARIAGHLDLADTDRLAELARDAHQHGDDYLLEAWAEFLTVELGGTRQPVVPSGHFRNGRVADGITLQALDGFAWRGNSYLDEAAWVALGLPILAYRSIRGALQAVHESFLGPQSVADHSYQGLAVGGLDFAVGRLGGKFGDRIVVGTIDFNLSSHGAEYLRAFQDELRTLADLTSTNTDSYGATHVFVPPTDATLHDLAARLSKQQTRPGSLISAIACVPGRWAMIAASGSTPDQATRRVREL